MVEDEVGVGGEIAHDGHIIDAPAQGEGVHAHKLRVELNAEYVGCRILGAEDRVEIMRPKVVAHPPKDENPKVALHPVPAKTVDENAECHRLGGGYKFTMRDQTNRTFRAWGALCPRRQGTRAGTPRKAMP